MVPHRKKVQRSRFLGRPPPPFSVALKDAITSATYFMLSAVRIPLNWCHPFLQRSCKALRFSLWNQRLQHRQQRRTAIRLRSFTLLLFSLLCIKQTQAVHVLPNSSFGMIQGECSSNISQQRSYIRSAINASTTVNQHHPVISNVSSSPDASIRNEPICFITDSDSVHYVVDTGANRIIVNDARLLTRFTPSSSNIKGVGGTKVKILGTGILTLHFKNDNGTSTSVRNLSAVLVPSSPYNLIPPQILIKQMKLQDYTVNHSKHDETEYIFNYKKIDDASFQTLTVPISPNGLFSLHTKEGYSNFMSRASAYCSYFGAFAGAIDDSSCSPSSAPLSTCEPPRKTREPPYRIRDISSGKTRESSHDKTRELSSRGDFVPIRSTPHSSNFCLPCTSQEIVEDPSILATRRKQLRLLTIHESLGHLSFSVLKLMARCGIIPRELESVDPPTCPGCAYGKAHRLQWRFKGVNNVKTIRKATAPGQVISMDQLVSPTPGFVPIHRGTPTNKRFIGATIFVDHFSDYTYAHLMTEMTGKETTAAKEAFERILSSYNVTAQHYHADNGLFDTAHFKNSIKLAGQTLSFCGVNAHHQNGKAERRIGDVTTGARTSLLHAAHRWPKAIHSSLWPSAIKNYVNLRNNIPTTFVKGIPDTFTSSPLSKLSGSEVTANLKDFHPFGSPVYVLENKLQSRKSYNKWSDRSRVGIFLCHSPSHSSNVPLILNTSSANVSPQFHCLYDDDFSTCKVDAKFSSVWQIKAKIKEVSPAVQDLVDKGVPIPQSSNPPSSLASDIPSRFVSPWDLPTVNTPPSNDNDAVLQTSTNPDIEPTVTPVILEEQPAPTLETIQDDSTATTTRSGRIVRPASRFADSALSSLLAYSSTFSPNINTTQDSLLQPSTTHYEEPHPFASICQHMFAFVTTDPDTMPLKEALQQTDRAEFIAAMYKELNDHISRKHWKVIPLKHVPPSKKCIPMVWSMKRKRNHVGEVTKWKARLCAGGHRSVEFVDFWDTYSPVVSWQTVRLVFILAIINNWHIRSIDFVLAFPQASVKTDIFMRPPSVPTNFKIPDLPLFSDRFTKVYKLLKNLYGLKDAGRTWNIFLHNGLIARGWKRSSIDECLYTKENLILILYVDDACIISPSENKIKGEIASLQKDFDLTDDGPLQDYLGTRFQRNTDGSVLLTQPRMIERALQLVGLHKDSASKTHDTPANKILSSFLSTPRKQSWHYRSVVGCLSYIQAMNRPDITFATQQCARFNNNPSKEHEEAVKRICRYLLLTKDKGLLLKPDTSRGLECFVDADWAGSWTHESSHDPISTRSRTGFVIMYAGCPLLWKSSMQSLTALSTTEAEYVALSSALRSVINVINLMQDLKSKGFPMHHSTPKIKCRTFEDNMSCIKLATNHRIRPRTKHFSLRLHHFRSHIIDKTISIEYVHTDNQLADIFTKPLAKPQFCKLRQGLMSW